MRTKSPVAPTVNDRRLSPVQASRLKAAERAERAGDPVQARRLRMGVEQELAAHAETDWRRRALAETAVLEAGRGAQVEVRPGRVRIDGRDGLEALRSTGAITAAQHGAGLRYRDRFEAAQHQIGSALAIRPGGARGDGRIPEAVAARVAQANRDMSRMEGAVRRFYGEAGREGLTPDALAVLRTVAGLGGAIRNLASSGARREALKRRLCEALDAVAGARV